MKFIQMIVLAGLFVGAWGCSVSSEGEGSGADTDTDTDTDVDTDTDTDTDTDGDTDTDSDTDSETGTGPECECFNADLDCCDGCYWNDTDYACDPAKEVDYGCASGNCGGVILVRYKAQYCPGTMGSCIGDVDEEFGDWHDAGPCGDNEVCVGGGDAGPVGCDIDLETCPIGFGDRVCMAGGLLDDCGLVGCPDPLPSHTEDISVADFGAGEVVRLEIYTNQRGTGIFNPGMPFDDILATFSHDGATVAEFYNNYEGVESAPGPVYNFPADWYLPHFWGEEMGGDWQLWMEDSAYSGLLSPLPFDITEWCVTFVEPGTISIETEGTWDAADVGSIAFATTEQYEMQINDIVDATGQYVWLDIDLDAVEPTDIALGLRASDGTDIVLKAASETTIEDSYLIEGMGTDWVTGRWAIRIIHSGTTSTVAATLSSWAIRVGDEAPDTDAGVDGGMDAGADAGK